MPPAGIFLEKKKRVPLALRYEGTSSFAVIGVPACTAGQLYRKNSKEIPNFFFSKNILAEGVLGFNKDRGLTWHAT
jgi:hypothetical protein